MTFNRIACLTTCTCALIGTAVWAAEPGNVKDEEDNRIDKIRQFFLAQRSPLAKHAEVFLGAADKHGLDWRLLPSLAIVESAGGGVYRNNNVFGWGNGRIRFESIGDSIRVVAERLTNALPYRNKTVEGKLKAYNPVNKKYADHVLGIMESIGPVPSTAPAAR
jgi:hypothetical protein